MYRYCVFISLYSSNNLPSTMLIPWTFNTKSWTKFRKCFFFILFIFTIIPSHYLSPDCKQNAPDLGLNHICNTVISVLAQESTQVLCLAIYQNWPSWVMGSVFVSSSGFSDKVSVFIIWIDFNLSLKLNPFVHIWTFLIHLILQLVGVLNQIVLNQPW